MQFPIYIFLHLSSPIYNLNYLKYIYELEFYNKIVNGNFVPHDINNCSEHSDCNHLCDFWKSKKQSS